MKTVKAATSACRYCRFYHSEGRRGGNCQQLGVPVQGGWKACSLADQPFTTQWDEWSGIISRQRSNPEPQPVVAEIALQPIGIPEIDPVATTTMIEEVFLAIE